MSIPHFQIYKHTIEIIFASKEYITSKLSYTGTHSNTYLGLDATGKKIQYKGIFIFKIKDGLINEMHGWEDDLTSLIK